MPDPDETIRIRPNARPLARPGRRRRSFLVAAVLAGMLGAAGVAGMTALRDGGHAIGKPPDVAIPLASEQAILAARPARPALSRFADNPRILVLSFPSMHEQADMLNRVAALTEVSGLERDRIADPQALDRSIRARGAEPDTFYFGHDYSAGELARFFAIAARDGVMLTPGEVALRGFCHDLLDGADPPEGALISLPTSDAGPDNAARSAILRHELSHGEYFTSGAYAAYVRTFWRTVLTEEERSAFAAFLARQQYDVGDTELVMNETQAYLVHTPDSRFFSAGAVGLAPGRVAALRDSFVAFMPEGWLRRRALDVRQ